MPASMMPYSVMLLCPRLTPGMLAIASATPVSAAAFSLFIVWFSLACLLGKRVPRSDAEPPDLAGMTRCLCSAHRANHASRDNEAQYKPIFQATRPYATSIGLIATPWENAEPGCAKGDDGMTPA